MLSDEVGKDEGKHRIIQMFCKMLSEFNSMLFCLESSRSLFYKILKVFIIQDL